MKCVGRVNVEAWASHAVSDRQGAERNGVYVSQSLRHRGLIHDGWRKRWRCREEVQTVLFVSAAGSRSPRAALRLSG